MLFHNNTTNNPGKFNSSHNSTESMPNEKRQLSGIGDSKKKIIKSGSSSKEGVLMDFFTFFSKIFYCLFLLADHEYRSYKSFLFI
jgi:hypothetical protein